MADAFRIDPGPVAAIIVKAGKYDYAPEDMETMRKQIDAAFPGVPVIFIAPGTDLEVIYATQ